jgi:serine phosphatase RsbU (regulator of sigma subunit)
MDSITYAKRIQSAILPPAKVVKEYLQESFIFYKPKDIVAGDFYWLESICHSEPVELSTNGSKESSILRQAQDDNSNIVLFAAADCTGHGVPGAMVSVVCNNGLNRSVREYGLTDPGEILNKTREIVVQEFEKSEEEVKDGMDIAICSLEGNTLKYAGAHNPLWIIRPRHSGLDPESLNDKIAGQARNDDYDLIETKANKQPIGKFDNPEPYTTHTIELQKGDSLYIFSDGYADQFGGEKGKKLKTANFKKLLLSIQKENMTNQKQLINEAFENWKGNLEQLDDVCVIGVKI